MPKVFKSDEQYTAAQKKLVYSSWTSMRSRCKCKSDPYWESYGGRGITICEQWEDFKVFLKDMGLRRKNQSLDRIDVNGNYTPENCKWSTAKEQARNRRSSVYVEWEGKKIAIAELYDKFNCQLPYSCFSKRIYDGWDIKDALFKPLSQTSYLGASKAFQENCRVLFRDEYLNLREISDKYNINYNTLRDRINYQKMSLEEAVFSKPKKNVKHLFKGQMLTVKEISALTNVKKRTLQARIAKGTLYDYKY